MLWCTPFFPFFHASLLQITSRKDEQKTKVVFPSFVFIKKEFPKRTGKVRWAWKKHKVRILTRLKEILPHWVRRRERKRQKDRETDRNRERERESSCVLNNGFPGVS